MDQAVSGVLPGSPSPHPRLRRAYGGRPALCPPSEGAERERHWRHPQEMGESEVEAFLTHLAAERNVSASTQNHFWFLDVFIGIPREMFGAAALVFNPKGIKAFSPGLRASRYPGCR
jgi:hypothetical protein